MNYTTHWCYQQWRMLNLAKLQPGFLGMDRASEAGGAGVSVPYWRDEAAIAAWRAHGEHAEAREMGRRRWYASYSVRVALVEREYEWKKLDEVGGS